MPRMRNLRPSPDARAASDKPVAFAISLSENASSFGTISRVNQASSRWHECSRT